MANTPIVQQSMKLIQFLTNSNTYRAYFSRRLCDECSKNKSKSGSSTFAIRLHVQPHKRSLQNRPRCTTERYALYRLSKTIYDWPYCVVSSNFHFFR